MKICGQKTASVVRVNFQHRGEFLALETRASLRGKKQNLRDDGGQKHFGDTTDTTNKKS